MTLRQLFLIDAAGGLLSAIMLGVVLVRLQAWVGIPTSVLYTLAVFPLVFMVYDLVCYWVGGTARPTLMKIIAYLNFGYCGLSISAAMQHRSEITMLGWGYVLVEILILILLASYELKIARRESAGSVKLGAV